MADSVILGGDYEWQEISPQRNYTESSGNIPTAANPIEPSIRTYIAKRVTRFGGRVLPKPNAKTKLNTPPKISPPLNSSFEAALTPRTLRSFSVQLNQGDRESATKIAVITTIWETIPLTPATFLIRLSLLKLFPSSV